MCGIAGWVGDVADEAHLAERMDRALQHRGPDGNGFERVPGLGALVHTRLAVLDPTERGNQPMSSPDRAVSVVFNGEIYNHRELRRDLEARGHTFKGHSDTEVLPALYLEHGTDFASRLRGMFAVGVLDRRAGRLVLARDRFGVKPLFYAPGADRLAFASEIPALRLLPGVDLSPDAQAVHDFLALHVVPGPATVYRGIRSLEPGELLVVERRHGRVSTRARRYHRWVLAPDPSTSMGAAVGRTGELLDAAVASQLESDVPLGGLLSGGIDSSLVCGSAQRALGGGLRTFGVAFDDPSFDESPAITEAAARLGTDHEMLDFGAVTPSWDSVTAVLRSAGQPFADTSLFAVHALSRLVRSRVTVALSGDGGDEGFAGYDHYGRLRPLAWAARLPWPLRRAALLGASGAARPLARSGRVSAQVPYRLLDAASCRSPTELVADQISWVRPRELARLWAGPPVDPPARLFERQWHHELPPDATALDRLTALTTEVDTRLRLAYDYLPKVDVASMAASLEVRVPLLDEELFAYALTLPTALKWSPSGSKVVLRRLASRRVPEVASLPKQGFGVPVDRWVDDSFRDHLREELLGPRSTLPSFLDPEGYRPIVEAFVASSAVPGITRQGLYQRAFMLLALDLALGPVPETPAGRR